MNYFALAGGILAALWALHNLATIIRVALGKARWTSAWGFWFAALIVAGSGTLAAWLFGMVAA